MRRADTLPSVARSRMSYAEAVHLLTGGTDVTTVLGRLAGGALLLAAPFAPGLVLSLFDAKGEANALLRDLVGNAPARIKASRGKRHFELLEAAHTVLVVSSFFDALADRYGEGFGALELSDEEKERITTGDGHPLHDELQRPAPPMPGATHGFVENLLGVHGALQFMAEAFDHFVRGLAAGERMPAANPDMAAEALARYRERYVRLSADVPEFAIWSQLDEHATTRAEVRRQTDTLTRLADLLAATVTTTTPAAAAEERLARHSAEVLRRRLWRGEDADGVVFPTVEKGFVSPHFRMTVAGKESRLADEDWWQTQPPHVDLARFLAAYFADPAAAQQPLVILGHPGAGKSLLTEVLAARLPADAFTTIRVPLRAVTPDAQIHQQVEETVEKLVKERISWGELCRASDTTKVVILDGFDELVQATGVSQSHYIGLASGFQQEEWINGRPVAVVITSRTLVMDRTAVPEGTIVIKLDPFDERQVGRWVEVWNAANAAVPGARPLTTPELLARQDLAGQPLLLLMLATYATQGGVRLDAEHLTTEDLYRRLLDEFIRRQVREKASKELGPGAHAELQAHTRRDLAAAAFAMVNRGRQYVSEDDLERDLEALHPDDTAPPATTGEPLTRARRTIAGFFFVHVAKTDDDTRAPGRRTYEFLHATFAEYLVAEQITELLRDLADDWQRSRRRSYGASLDVRVLRALLSHQPLTNGERILPFLTAMIGSLPAEVRAELCDALLELFGAARAHVPDDPYRPTPFDVVTRVAAYTANLVLLALICKPEGIPDASRFESTIRLWRAGLDPDAQAAFLSQLERTSADVLILGEGSTIVPIAESQLTGDRHTETILKSGMTLFTGPQHVTDFDRDFHLQVVNLIRSRWPGRPAGRMMPYDENLYAELAAVAERSDEEPHPESLDLLFGRLIDDAAHLPPELVDRILSSLIAPEAGFQFQSQHLQVLGLRRPELLTRHPSLRQQYSLSDYPDFIHDVAVGVRDQEPAVIDSVITDLRAAIMALPPGTHSNANATPAMVGDLVFSPATLPPVIRGLHMFGEIAWPQVAPHSMLAAVEAMGDAAGDVAEALADYLACRADDDLDEEDLAALAEIRNRLPG
jgi:hypothetical protein